MYRSAWSLALTVVILTLLQMLLTCVRGINGAVALGASADDAQSIIALSLLIEFAVGLLHLTTIIVFLVWVHRSIANLTPLGAQFVHFTPSGAVWVFFIPLLNLFQVWEVVANIWTDSDSSNDPPTSPRSSLIVTLWWLLTLASEIVGRIEGYANGGADTSMHDFATLAIVAGALTVPSGLFFIAIVWFSQKRQDARWRLIAAK